MRPAATPAAGQAGLTLVEVLLAAALGAVVVLLGGILFVGQVRGYRDLDFQAKMQTQAKIAVQGMVRDITNTGAVLDNKRLNFRMQTGLIQFAYIDLKERYCGPTDTVTSAFFVADGTPGDTLVQTVRCNSAHTLRRAIVKGVGPITLGFAYYDSVGNVTANPARVKQVQFNLDLQSPQGQSLMDRSRNPKVRVELTN